ncbi:unknown [Bacteroides sp. CAG:462]|nr:unknown [Bacteroides sp. CAG:462]
MNETVGIILSGFHIPAVFTVGDFGKRQFPDGYMEAFPDSGHPVCHDRLKSRPEGLSFTDIGIRDEA